MEVAHHSTCTLVPPIRPGTRASIRPVFPYRLPAGLRPNSEVTVEQVSSGMCIVRDYLGNQWHVDVMCLDPGRLVWRDGRWVPEMHRPRPGQMTSHEQLVSDGE